MLHVAEIPASWCGASDASPFSPECFQAFVESERQRLQEYALDVPETTLRRVVAEGSPAWEIAKCASNYDVDLIVMGTRGLGRFRGLLMGSVAAQVLHDVDCPVWTDSPSHRTRGVPQPDYTSIVCALDIRDEAVAVLRFARALAREFSAKVQVVHSVPKAETRPNKYFDFDLHACLMDSARVAISKLQREAGTEFPITLKDCAVPRAVSEFALEQNAGLVVIGRGTLQEPLGRLRTHAYQIIRDAPCPVLSCIPFVCAG